MISFAKGVTWLKMGNTDVKDTSITIRSFSGRLTSNMFVCSNDETRTSLRKLFG